MSRISGEVVLIFSYKCTMQFLLWIVASGTCELISGFNVSVVIMEEGATNGTVVNTSAVIK